MKSKRFAGVKLGFIGGLLRLFLMFLILFGVSVEVHANWIQVNTDGFGDINTESADSMAVYNSLLYSGTENDSTGGEVWEYDGINWTQVNTDEKIFQAEKSDYLSSKRRGRCSL